MLPRLKRHYGNPVSGDYFWPRPDITGPIVDTLLAGESVKLFGLRRTGKSSVMLEVKSALEKFGRTVIYADVQGHDRVDKLVGALLSALPNSDVVSRLSQELSSKRVNQLIDFVNRVRGREATAPLSPAAVLHQVELVRGDMTAVLARQNGRIVLLIDELPFLLDNMLKRQVSPADINAFLATLRSWRQDGRVPMLLSGSMGLSWLMREWGLAREHFNDLVASVTPSPLDQGDARAMLRALALEACCDWMSDEIIDVAIDESAATYPSFLQFAFGRLVAHKAKTVEDVRNVFQTHIRPSLDEDFYGQFDTRLNRFKKEEREAARAILRRIDKSGDQPTDLTAIDQVLGNASRDRDDLFGTLVDDGFIAIDTRAQTAAFSSPLVRTWWQSKPYRR